VRVDPKQLVQTPEAQRHIAAIKDMAALSNIQSLADAPELVGDEHRTYTQAEVDQLRRAWALKYRNEPLP
jgi:hypothetical protein